MSQFLTAIAVDLERVKLLLPKQHFLESVTWNPIMHTVDLVWSSPGLVTPFSTPQFFPVQNLHDQTLPKGVNYREARLPPAGPAAGQSQPVVEKPVDKRKGRRIKAP